MKPFIKKLQISNYKSLTDLTVENIGAFAVFAGANGSGKSNFFDALKFVSDYLRFGITEALKLHGGWENIHSVKVRKEKARTFCFELEIEKKFGMNINGKEYFYNSVRYELLIKSLDSFPLIDEKVYYDDKKILHRYPDPEYKQQVINGKGTSKVNDNGVITINVENLFRAGSIVEDYLHTKEKEEPFSYQTVWDSSILSRGIFFVNELLQHCRVLRIDPLGAKIPTPSDVDSKELDERAHNLSAVLSRIEKDEDLRENIIEIMSTIVPQLQYIGSQKEKYQGSHILTFKEQGSKKEFPALMVSDGTIYALSLLIAVLDKSRPWSSWTLIEEPERGLHPQAIIDIVSLMREKASDSFALHPIWLTTHNTTLVRSCKPEELFFVEKHNGSTIIKKPLIDPPSVLPLDEAWLSNSLNGGLPW